MRRAANAWDRFYRQHEAPWRGERPLAPLRPWLGDGADPVLELGCGNGKLLRPLERAGFDVVGLDVSWHALRRLGRGVLADAAALPFRDAAFGCVLDIHCTGHLDGPGRAASLREAHRVLRPDGHLVVERLGADDLRAGQGEPVADDPGARRLADGRTTHCTDEAGLRGDLVAAGFTVVESWTDRRTPRLRTGRVVRESVTGVGQRRLPGAGVAVGHARPVAPAD